MGIDKTVDMEVGGATFRPGSVRHGGSKVTKGVRFILGGFLLIEDRVEHVRRLKNRGAGLRREGKLMEAKKCFEWALAMSPKCCTCMKDLSELYMTLKDFSSSESILRDALLLIPNDSDALFSLGVLLSEMGGRDEESREAYVKSAAINAEDHELMYNLAMKFGDMGNVEREREYYGKCVEVKEDYGPAWLNWGTSLAEAGELDGAAEKFREAGRGGDLQVKSLR
ncbi:hypothetical protein TrRE_jg12830 [Triparma retinervis]|uniref:Uncharacterized protein n=1 Tax=Triparma retinervis TaxID=2557542 RepID=A0A9W7FH53_9STRA|nr:hypothetical protein TrRE_jg12830 [Triparma retinervis]